MFKLETCELRSWWVSAEQWAGHSRFINNKGKGKKFKKPETEVSDSGKTSLTNSVKEDDAVSWGHADLAPLDTGHCSLQTLESGQERAGDTHLPWVSSALGVSAASCLRMDGLIWQLTPVCQSAHSKPQWKSHLTTTSPNQAHPPQPPLF